MTGQPDRPQSDNPDRPTADEPLPENAGAEGAQPADNSELEVLQAQADENWDKYLRAMAELDNVRKRSQRDVENARKFALEPFARELLNVRDSLEMGLATSAGAEPAPLRQGFEATLKQLATTMEQFGIQELDPHGEPFDPQQHEAMSLQPSADVEPGTVLTVYQKGYSLNGRLLRPARVVVSAAVETE